MTSEFQRSPRVHSTRSSRRSFLALSVLAGVGLPVLAGCDIPAVSRDRGSASASGSASAKGRAKAGGADWQELDAHIMGHKVAVRVSPVIRQDDKTTIIALEMTRAKDDASINDIKADSYSGEDNKLSIAYYLGSPSVYRPAAGASLVRLLDLESGRVWSATDGSGRFLEVTPGEKITSYLSFGKVDTDTVTVMVPMAGFVTVSVLESDAAKKADVDLNAANKELSESPDTVSALAEPVAIERYTRALDGSTSTQAGGKDVTVTLASDVTFASDSADLTPAADAQLQTVSGQLAQYPDGGTLTIVGHTDDVQDDAYNQTLSEKRANAVKTRLEQLTTLDKWKTSATGKGESEPRVSGTSDDARAANRRVEITLTPTGGTAKKEVTASPGASPSSNSLPEVKGPTAKGTDGVTLTVEGTGSGGTKTSGEVTITLDHVTRSGGYLLGTITCTVKDGSTGADLISLLGDPGTILGNQRDETHGAIATFKASDGLTLIAGGERIFPADYQEADLTAHIPLTELYVKDALKGGAVATICAVWPDPGSDTITLDHQADKFNEAYAFRLTDIPVKNN